MSEMKYLVRWRENDKANWKNTAPMSKENADGNAEFLNAYGYRAKVCVAE